MLTQDQIDGWEDDYYPTTTEMVQEFAKVMGQTPDPDLYGSLIEEEFSEWSEAMPESEHELKELADLVYVIYGYANAMGYDLDEAVYRVHSNNIGRCKQPDGSIKRRPDGKILKNPDYPAVDLSDLV